jgi:hypothetical protein
MGVFDSVKANIAKGSKGLSGGLSTVNNIIGDAGETATNALKEGADAVLGNSAVKTGLGVFNQVSNIYSNLKGLVGAAKSFLNDPYQVVPNPLLGGYSRQETQKLARLALSKAYAKNNLFLVRFFDKNWPNRRPKGSVSNFEDGLEKDHNTNIDLLAMNVSFNPIAITGDAVKLGLLQGDSIQQSERVEIRMTFFDVQDGSIKRFLAAKKAQMINKDGTANPPDSYTFEVLIIHLNQTAGTTKVGGKLIGVFDEDTLIKQSYSKYRYLVRVSSLDIDLNKREDSLQELQVTFTEVDSFMTVGFEDGQ